MIAFIDKNVAMGITIVSIVLSFVYPTATAGNAVKDVCSRALSVDWFAVVFLLVLGFSLLTTILALIHAYKTIFPRGSLRRSRSGCIRRTRWGRDDASA